MILGVIETSKKGASENSVVGYVKSIETTTAKKILEVSNYRLEDKTYRFDELEVDYRGLQPKNGCVVVKNGEIVAGSFALENYIIDYQKGKAKVNAEKKEIDCVSMGGDEIESQYHDATGANLPKLEPNMIPVVYENGNWVKANTKEKWYDYATQMWANVVTVAELV